jgi:hypothetical protein
MVKPKTRSASPPWRMRGRFDFHFVGGCLKRGHTGQVAERDVEVLEMRAPQRPEHFVRLFALVFCTPDVGQLQPSGAASAVALAAVLARVRDPWGRACATTA